MPSKVIAIADAAAHFRDGISVLFGGFMGVGTPPLLIEALLDSNARDLVLIGNDTAFPDVGVGRLISARRVRKVVASHIGTNAETGRQMIAGDIEVELVPQGTLAERIRCGGSGIPAFFTPTGASTPTYATAAPVRVGTRYVGAVVLTQRLHDSRLGRAWMAIREDEIAAKAMGLNVRNLKLLAFGLGAMFGGVSGVLFASFQGFVSPESFSLQESVLVVAMVVLGGLGHIPGVILGAFLLAALPEVLRHVAGPLQELSGGRLDAAILRQLLIALAMIGIMLVRPRGLWPSPRHEDRLIPEEGAR